MKINNFQHIKKKKKEIKKTGAYDDIIITNKEDFIEINVLNTRIQSLETELDTSSSEWVTKENNTES